MKIVMSPSQFGQLERTPSQVRTSAHYTHRKHECWHSLQATAVREVVRAYIWQKISQPPIRRMSLYHGTVSDKRAHKIMRFAVTWLEEFSCWSFSIVLPPDNLLVITTPYLQRIKNLPIMRIYYHRHGLSSCKVDVDPALWGLRSNKWRNG